MKHLTVWVKGREEPFLFKVPDSAVALHDEFGPRFIWRESGRRHVLFVSHSQVQAVHKTEPDGEAS